MNELHRLLVQEDLLWCKATAVTQQALSKRFLEFPAGLFERVFFDWLPPLRQRWQARSQRPLPVRVKWANQRFTRILEVRWVAIRHGDTWYRYLTSVLDPTQLPP